MPTREKKIMHGSTGDKSLSSEYTDQRSLKMTTKWLQNPILPTCFTFSRESFLLNAASLFPLKGYLSGHLLFFSFQPISLHMHHIVHWWNVQRSHGILKIWWLCMCVFMQIYSGFIWDLNASIHVYDTVSLCMLINAFWEFVWVSTPPYSLLCKCSFRVFRNVCFLKSTSLQRSTWRARGLLAYGL